MLTSVIRYLMAFCSWNRPLTILESVNQCGILRVGFTGDYAPYSFKTANGDIIGADVEMARDLAAYLNVKLEIVETTWSTLTSDLLTEKFDIAMGGISVNENRKKFGYFTEPLLTDGKRPIVRCEDKNKYTTVDAINRKEVRVVVNPGGTNFRFAQANFDKTEVRVFGDNRIIFKEIAENRADVMVTDGIEVDLQSKKFSGVLCPANVEKPFNTFEKAYWTRKDSAFLKKVNNWLNYARTNVWPKALEHALNAEYS